MVITFSFGFFHLSWFYFSRFQVVPPFRRGWWGRDTLSSSFSSNVVSLASFLFVGITSASALWGGQWEGVTPSIPFFSLSPSGLDWGAQVQRVVPLLISCTNSWNPGGQQNFCDIHRSSPYACNKRVKRTPAVFSTVIQRWR